MSDINNTDFLDLSDVIINLKVANQKLLSGEYANDEQAFLKWLKLVEQVQHEIIDIKAVASLNYITLNVQQELESDIEQQEDVIRNIEVELSRV